MDHCEVIKGAILAGELGNIPRLVHEALEKGRSPQEIINEGLIAGMYQVGLLFKNSEIYLPEVIVSARTMHAALGILRPLLKQGEMKSSGTVVIGTVKSDVHDIGKNLVAMMLEGAGFEVVDIGVDQPAERFVEAAQTKYADAVALSALLSTTMKEMPVVIEALNRAGLRDRVKIMVGGAPITESFARSIGADGYAPDGSSAVEELKKLLHKG
jgi:5-methyltetrahydrofolate--homocysteine methyltransferase